MKRPASNEPYEDKSDNVSVYRYLEDDNGNQDDRRVSYFVNKDALNQYSDGEDEQELRQTGKANQGHRRGSDDY